LKFNIPRTPEAPAAAWAWVGKDGIQLHPQEDDDGTLCGRGNPSLYTKLAFLSVDNQAIVPETLEEKV